ncbi:MAG: polymer-forming cytoskeletal protein [Campylobacterota bacterium]|nr:polymer-forming cytoskeletal protein [Campylobacterota bacterium]
MSIFGKSSKEEQVTTASVKKSTGTSVSTHSTTIITKCMNIKGDIEGCGTIHIDGIVHGDLTIEDSVVIGVSGKVYGNIKSKKVIISGLLEGSIACTTLEVTKTGNVSDKIDAVDIISDGTLKATIYAEKSIHIKSNGNVETEGIEAKNIIVNGLITGDITVSELLEISKDGQVKGTMRVKKIKVTEGGLMLGTMLTYSAANTVSKKSEDEVEDQELIGEEDTE